MKLTEQIDNFITSYFGDRVSSPLYSTFLISWVLWNWKALYVTFIVDSTQLPPEFINKLQYVVSFTSWCLSLVYPLISTFVFIFIMPFAANIAYKQSLKFKRQRMKDKSEIIDKDRSFTRDQVDEMIQGYLLRARSLDEEINGIQRQLKTEKEISNSRIEESKRFKILTANYGLYGIWADVSNDLTRLNDEFSSFVVSNNSFSVGDPVPNNLKQLIICYQNENGIHTVVANEGDKVTYNNKVIVVVAGTNTSEWKNALK